MQKRSKGLHAENAARQWLEAQGLRHLESNYTRKTGEIDLIMLHDITIVFVEVRYRQRNDFGGSIHSITPAKQRKLINTALLYLQEKRVKKRPARIDVIAMQGSIRSPEFRWLKNAIES